MAAPDEDGGEDGGDGGARDGGDTEALITPTSGGPAVRRFLLRVVDGPARGHEQRSSGDRCTIGSHASNDLVLDDATVSRFHCEVVIDPGGVHVRDLGSRNGVIVDGVRVSGAFLRSGSSLRLGRSALAFQLEAERVRLPLSERRRFGKLCGESVAMRTTFALLERAAMSDATVLLEGETGTGKEGAAASLHAESARRGRPLVVLDCSAIPEALLESELFGHEKGAFTGASERRIGAFEEAQGGTIFLDEIGELPAALQPKLLRVLEAREVRRVGGSQVLPVDVRVIAATNRDLRAEVNGGRFRADLYFRLAVVKIALPPLRARPEDIPLLVDEMLASLGARGAARAALQQTEFLAALQRAAWPGNVRELRNHLERCLVFEDPLPLGDEAAASAAAVDASLPYEEARRRAIADFERRYVAALLQAHGGRVAEAARAADVDKAYLYRLVRRYDLRT